MNLSYSEEYEAFRREVRAFLDEHWTQDDRATAAEAPILAMPRQQTEREAEFRRKAVGAGYLYKSVPREYGGSEQAFDAFKSTIIVEEFRVAKAPREIPGQGVAMLVPTLVEHGTTEQKEQFIQPTIQGDLIWCQGYSEPGAGSDLASLRTKGELDGDHWVVNGQKIWTSNASEADWMFALVRTEPDAPKHQGITYMLIKMDTPGIEVRPLKQLNGGTDFTEVFLENVRVPKDSIVNKRGEGWSVSRSTLKHERAFIGGTDYVRKTFDGLVMLAQFTNLRGRPAIKNEGIQERLVSLEARLIAAEYHGKRLLTMSGRKEDTGLAGLITKNATSQLQHDLVSAALDIMGDGAALATGEEKAPFSGMFVDAYMWTFALLIGGGTTNIQRNIVAERGLGLPRDPATKR
jgi:alkylation response protein AidB-like acyl-CoA dehydrogenase